MSAATLFAKNVVKPKPILPQTNAIIARYSVPVIALIALYFTLLLAVVEQLHYYF
ncbi:hypothetical protein ACIQYL_03535 [Lysinibacillus xylanilyticus]|uniref:hypothetical protein n=1 Tax=Lysinibacillus xylanilyticus TaxID=582475 RepID=UPI00382F5660